MADNWVTSERRDITGLVELSRMQGNDTEYGANKNCDLTPAQSEYAEIPWVYHTPDKEPHVSADSGKTS